MTSPNRRKADRVDVGIPIQLRTASGDHPAEIVDLSRTGLRVRMPVDSARENATQAAERMRHALSPSFSLDMDYERLGPLLNKDVEPIRVGIPKDAPDVVEICGEFFEYLEDEEVHYLQLNAPLPELRDSVDVWVDVEPEASEPEEPAPTTGVPVLRKEEPGPSAMPRQRYRALVAGMKRDAPPSFFCHTDMVTRMGVRVRLQREDAGIEVGEHVSVSKALQTLVSLYGPELELRLVDGSGDVWSGPSRFSGVELPSHHPEEVLVTLSFGRPLSLADLRRLDLIGGAA